MSKLNTLFGLALLCTIAAVNCVEQAPGAPGAIGVPGGHSDLSAIELTELHTKLKPAFVQLAVEHTGFNWMPVRVIDAKKQTVAGTKYLANVEVKNSSDVIKKCTADIWEKTFEKFFQVELKCENDAKNYKYVKQL